MADAQARPDPPPPDAGLHQVAWLMDRSAESAMLTDAAGRIEYVNPAFEVMTGYGRAEAIGRTPALLRSGLQPPEVYAALWRTLHAGQEFRGLLVNRRKNGELFHEEKSIRPLFGPDGRITHFLSCGRDVSAQVAALARLERAATHDALTELPNRALFDERLGAAIRRVRDGGAGFAVALIDVDRFKQINDSHGHAAGDSVLQAVARRLLQAVRKSDTVARLGGDEFALLLEGNGSADDAAPVLDTIVGAFAPAVTHGDERVFTSVSIGACIDLTGELEPQQLLERADAAMYQVKRDGGSGYRIYTEDPVTASAPLGAEVSPDDAGGPLPGPDRPLWRRRTLKAGECLYRNGQRLTHLYVLRRGTAQAFVPAADGGGAAQRHGEGDWLGLDGLATRRHHREARMLVDGEVWVIAYDELLEAARRSPAFMARLMEAFGRALEGRPG